MANPDYEFRNNKLPAVKKPVTATAQPGLGGEATSLQDPNRRSFSDVGSTTSPQPLTATKPRSFSDLTKPAEDVVSGQLGATATPGISDTLARNQFQKAAGEATRQVQEQGALSGRVGTGQMTGDLSQHLQKSILPARMDLEARLVAGSESRATAERQQGVQNVMGMESLNQQDKALAQEASQFSDQMSFQKYALQAGIDADTAARAWQASESAKGRESQEGIAYAGLNLQEKQMAQQASQFGTEMEWNKYALDKGIDAETAKMAWQSSEAEKGRSFQAGESELGRSFQAGESELDRGLQEMLTDKGLDLDYAQLGEQIRQYDSRLDFDRWATEAGFDENDKNRMHDMRVQEIQNKFQTGERLGSQDHQYLLEDKKTQSAQSLMQLEQTLNFQTMEQQNTYDEMMMGLQNGYATAAQQAGFSHDTAMTELTNNFTKQLTEMGYSHADALQAATFKAQEINQNREHTFLQSQAAAQMAQESEFFFEEMGLKREQIDSTMDQWKEEFGINKEIWADDQINRNLERAAITMELAGDNNDMMDMAAEQFVNSIAGTLGWGDDQKALAIDALGAPEEELEEGKATQLTREDAYDTIDDLKDDLPADMNYDKQLKKFKDTLNLVETIDPNQKTGFGVQTREDIANDKIAYEVLINDLKLPEKKAKEIFLQVVGQERYDKAGI